MIDKHCIDLLLGSVCFSMSPLIVPVLWQSVTFLYLFLSFKAEANEITQHEKN